MARGEQSQALRLWGLFALALLAHRALLGLVYGLVQWRDLPAHVGYAVDIDRSVFGAPLAHQVQRALGGELGWGLVHLSVYPVMLAVAYLVWRRAPAAWGRYVAGVLGVSFASLLGHLGAPTVPPYLASELGVGAPVAHATGLDLPSLAANPLATSPSLPFALSLVVAVMALQLLGRRALPLLGFAMAVAIAELYRGEAYLVSLVVAALFVALVLAVLHRREVAPVQRRGRTAAILVAIALTAGLGATWLATPWQPSLSFAQRELLGRTPTGYRWVGVRAFEAGDYRLAAGAFEKLSPEQHDAGSLLAMARTHVALGNFHLADRVFLAAERAAPDDPRPLYYRARGFYRAGRASEEDVLATVHRLHQHVATDRARALAGELEAMLEPND